MILAEVSPGPTFSFSFHIQTIQVYHYYPDTFLNSRVHLYYLLFPFPGLL